MIRMNPIVTSVTLKDNPSSTTAFYKSVPAAYHPPPTRTEPIPVFEVIEDTSVETPEARAAGNWRGGWAKRFIPDQLKYETSFETKEDGMRCLTHAAMGVSSMTLWTVKEGDDGTVLVEKEGSVTSNRMLMGFIATTLKDSHETLAVDFVKALERYVADLNAAQQGTPQ